MDDENIYVKGMHCPRCGWILPGHRGGCEQPRIEALRAVLLAAEAACDAWSADCEEPNALPVHDTMAALREALDAAEASQ